MLSLVVFRRLIMVIQETAVEYIPGEGAACPASKFVYHKNKRVHVACSKGDGVRHHKCPECGLSFKSVEKTQIDEVLAEVVTIPKRIAAKPKGKHYKKREK